MKTIKTEEWRKLTLKKATDLNDFPSLPSEKDTELLKKKVKKKIYQTGDEFVAEEDV